MSDYTENAANEIAELALADELLTGDEKIVQNIAEIMGASSQTLEEAFLTAIRVRRAEKRARELLAGRAAQRDAAAAAPETASEDPAEAVTPDAP
ncbi:MAG: hypothetical protein AAFP98_09065 [Pseudomonadota bacterium]